MPLSFLSATSDSALIFSYLGQESRGGSTVQHIQLYRYLMGQKAASIAITQQVSTTDIYLDATSLLPSAIVFNTHPDTDAAANILVEIDFLNYQSVNGVQVPFHIQKLIQNGLALDLVLKNVVFNSGLQDSLFVQ